VCGGEPSIQWAGQGFLLFYHPDVHLGSLKAAGSAAFQVAWARVRSMGEDFWAPL
jgi:hypothetical protein